MPLKTLLSQPSHLIALTAGLAGMIMAVASNHIEEARNILVIGRAYERRNTAFAQVIRHNDYRHSVKTATGSRLHVPRA